MATITDTLAVLWGVGLEGRSVGTGTWNHSSGATLDGTSDNSAVELSAIGGGEYPYYPGTSGSSGTAAQNLATASVYAQAEFKMVGATTNRFWGFRLRWGSDFYLGRWYAGNLEIYRFAGGTYPLLGTTALALSTGTWYTLRFEVSNNRQYVAIGATSVTTTDSNISFSGSANGVALSLYTLGAPVAGSDTIQVRNFTAEDVAAAASVRSRHRPRSLYTR
jgi:hypothetical protein